MGRAYEYAKDLAVLGRRLSILKRGLDEKTTSAIAARPHGAFSMYRFLQVFLNGFEGSFEITRWG